MQIVHDFLGTIVAALMALAVIAVGALAMAAVVCIMWPAAVVLDAIEREWLNN